MTTSYGFPDELAKAGRLEFSSGRSPTVCLPTVWLSGSGRVK